MYNYTKIKIYMNGEKLENENGANSSVSDGNFSGAAACLRAPVSLFCRLFNIVPSQWSRVAECWFITFFFKLGAAIGWTVLTAAFVSKFGISFLPTLFVMNACLIVLSTFFFEQLIMRMKREVLMILMLLFAAICLFFAAVLYDRAPFAFFALMIFAESIFLAQFNVFIPILVSDRFTPLESQKTFSFIESGETMGGLIGGILVGVLASKLPVDWFVYLWIFMLTLTVAVFIVASYFRPHLPALAFASKNVERKKTVDQIKLVFENIKKTPFLKGIIIVVLLQWFFMNILEFQYTKAVEQSVTLDHEPTIALNIDIKSAQASVVSAAADATAAEMQAAAPAVQETRALNAEQQTELTEKLGKVKGLFHGVAFLVQVLFASRLITGLGVIGSMILHPIVMLMSLVGMFLKFGFLSSVITKVSFEATNVVHKNAYFASHYAFPKIIRDQAAEALEGIVRPMGTVLGMFVILGLQLMFAGKDLSALIHLIMFAIMAVLLFVTIKLQSKYTHISKQQLFSDLSYPEKLNAIEILTQRGHNGATAILVEKLKNSANESPIVRMKLLYALGQYKDYDTLPEILDALYDQHPEVRLEAAHALMNFRDLGEHFYSQAFSRFRVIETLKEVFKKEKSTSVRKAIVRVFSILHEPAIVEFLLSLLKEKSNDMKAEGIYTLGLFRDPNAAYYILPFLQDENPTVKANAVIALWHLEKYKNILEKILDEMVLSDDAGVIKAAVFAMGEIGFVKKKKMHELLHRSSDDLKLEVAFALTKCADQKGFDVVLNHIISISPEEFESLRRFMYRLTPKAKNMVETVLINVISGEMNNLSEQFKGKFLHEIDADKLEKLRRLYKVLDQHEELHEIEKALQHN